MNTFTGRLVWRKKYFSDWNSPVGTMGVRMVGMGMNFGALALIARWAGQDSLGIIIVLNGAAFFGGVICSLGLPTLLLKTMTEHIMSGETAVASGHYHRGMALVLSISLIALAISGLAAIGQELGLFPSAIGNIGAPELMAIGICSSGMAIQFVGLSAIRAMKQPALSGFFQFCAQPLLLLIIFAVLHGQSKVISRFQAMGALGGSMIANAILVHWVAKRRLPARNAIKLEALPWIEIRSLWFLAILSSASANIPLFLGAILLDPAQIAVLGVPFRVSNLPMTIVAALGAYYAPIIREAHIKENYDRQNKELMESQWLGALLVLPALFVALICPDLILGIFHIHDSTATNLLILFTFAQLLIAGCGVCEQYLAMISKASLASDCMILSLVGLIPASIFLQQYFGTLGLGFGWALFAVVRQIAMRGLCSWPPVFGGVSRSKSK